MKLAAAGLTPISPTIAVVPMVEMADFAKTTKFPAVPRLTAAGPFGACTVKVAEPDLPPDVAVISAEPADTPVLDRTVATRGLAEAQATVLLMSKMLPSE